MYDDFDNKSPLEQWKEYKKEGGFYDYQQWLEENGYIKVEEWVPVRDFEDLYEVSDIGRIRNAWTGKVLKQQTNKKGYKIVCLSANGTQYTKSVHVLVASSFCEYYENGMDVHHKDTNKINNRLDNLKVCTRKEHVKHSIEDGTFKHNDFGKTRIRVKCIETGKIYTSLNECSRALSIDQSMISQYLRGKIKSCKGYTFEKVE